MQFLSLKFAIGTYFAASSVSAATGDVASLLSCLERQNVTVVTNSSTNWATASAAYNLRLQYEPAAITIPQTGLDVAASVTCAAAAGIKVQAKAGGHSYASYSSGGQDGSLVVSLEKFNNISILLSTNVVTIGAGQRLGNLAQGLYTQNKRALPHGTCAGVGVAGHLLHGGYGLASRAWGLTLDHVIAMDVVTWNGSLLHINNIADPDLYYAMRGAGDAFAIATTFYVRTLPAPESVIHFSIDLSSALGSIDAATNGFFSLQSFVLNSPLLTPNITFGIYTDNGGSLSLSGWCLECDSNWLQNTVLPKMLAGYTYSNPTLKQQSWLEALAFVAAPADLTQPLGSAYQEHDTFYAKSLVTKNSHPLTHNAIRSFWTYVIRNQGIPTPFYSIINLYGGPNSTVNAPASNFSAYSDRDALWVFQNYGGTPTGLPPFNPNTFAVVDGLNDAITYPQPNGNFSMYINYVDPNISPLEAALNYYGAPTYDRLLSIKAAYDPNNVFWNPQSVGNAVAL